jgi:hypothetical protein
MKRSFLIVIMLFGLAAKSLTLFAQSDTPPRPNLEKPPAPPASSVPDKTDGKALLTAARQAIGGEAALRAVQDITLKLAAKLLQGGADLVVKNETIIKYPNKSLTRISASFGNSAQGYDGEIAWQQTPRGINEFAGDNLAEFRNALHNDTIFLLKHFDAPGYQVEQLEDEKIEGRRVAVVLVKLPTTHEVRLYLDGETHLVVRKAFISKVSGTKIENEESYSDFRTVAGLRLPFKRLLRRNGQPFVEALCEEIKINTGVLDKLFVKPQ